MKAYILILISLLFSQVFNFKYEELALNTPYTLKSGDKLGYFQISLKGMKSLPNEIRIESQIFETKNPSSTTIGVYYQQFKKRNFNQIKKEVLGKPIILNSEFIRAAINQEQKIYLAIYCENCIYKINMIPSGELILPKTFVQNAPLRGLIEQGNEFSEGKNTTLRMDMYSANGVSGLIVAFFMIFVSVIACIIMMKIYVHNTALVEQPLKLGRVEA